LTAATAPPFQQTGTFTTPYFSREGVVHFPHPYATPPNVTLSSAMDVTAGPTGFRWSRPHTGDSKVTWTARGVRATAEQVAELVRRPPAFGDGQPALLEQDGPFNWARGETGEVTFPRPYAAPPSVEAPGVIVTEITPRGFKWKHPETNST